MSFVIENIRLRELAIIANSNKPIFDDFVDFLIGKSYSGLHEFVLSQDSERAKLTLSQYFLRPLPADIALYDGIARPYPPDKAKWLLLGWIFRDAPEQRLRPMLGSIEGASLIDRRVALFDEIRNYLGLIFPEQAKWEWNVISEVIIDRLEGSRRSIKGTLFEAIVREQLATIFEASSLNLKISKTEARISGETYDVQVIGKRGTILMPVKTRETMGGGHALLFTRDIHKSISAAHAANYECIPIVIAESWGGDLSALASKVSIYIDKNPNQIIEVRPLLEAELKKLVKMFKKIQ